MSPTYYNFDKEDEPKRDGGLAVADVEAQWKSLKQQALKVLGDSGQVPDLQKSVVKAYNDLDKSTKEFKASRDDLSDKILALQEGAAETKVAFEHFTVFIEKEDFGLDRRNKDDAKKIDKAQKMLLGSIGELNKDLDAEIKNLDELEKHMMGIKKYKPAR